MNQHDWRVVEIRYLNWDIFKHDYVEETARIHTPDTAERLRDALNDLLDRYEKLQQARGQE